MIVLSLDQALQTSGWAVFENEKLIECGTFVIQANKPIESRLGKIWENLNDLHDQYDFNYLAFEDTQQQFNVETFKRLCYVQAVIMLWCYYNEVKYAVLAPTHWRSVIGKGWGKSREEQKQHAIEWVKQTFNKEVTSDAADAVCIGWAAIKEKDKGSAF